MSALKIAYKDPGRLRPRPKNPRTHTARQIKQVAASIKEFGFINPILIDGADGIIAGHARVEAANRASLVSGTFHQARPTDPVERSAECN